MPILRVRAMLPPSLRDPHHHQTYKKNTFTWLEKSEHARVPCGCCVSTTLTSSLLQSASRSIPHSGSDDMRAHPTTAPPTDHSAPLMMMGRPIASLHLLSFIRGLFIAFIKFTPSLRCDTRSLLHQINSNPRGWSSSLHVPQCHYYACRIKTTNYFKLCQILKLIQLRYSNFVMNKISGTYKSMLI